MKQRLHELGAVIEASDLWCEGDDRSFWLGNSKGHMVFSEEKPEKPFAELKRCTDLDAVEPVEEPTVFVEWPSGKTMAFFPESWETEAPYEGRIFSLGKFDCYNLARDWFRRERGIEMSELDYSVENIRIAIDTVFNDNVELPKWEEVVLPQPGDGVLFSLQAADFAGNPNHCGVILEEGYFIHHLAGRLSVKEPFTESWKRRAVKFMRYRGG